MKGLKNLDMALLAEAPMDLLYAIIKGLYPPPHRAGGEEEEDAGEAVERAADAVNIVLSEACKQKIFNKSTLDDFIKALEEGSTVDALMVR